MRMVCIDEVEELYYIPESFAKSSDGTLIVDGFGVQNDDCVPYRMRITVRPIGEAPEIRTIDDLVVFLKEGRYGWKALGEEE